MYCPKCGTALQNGNNFCPNCGNPTGAMSSTNPTTAKKAGLPSWVLPVGAVIIAAVIGVSLLNRGNGSSSTESPATQTPNAPVTSEAPKAQASTPQEGWIQEDGKTYYIQNGVKCIGIVELDGDYYCFDENGVLQINTTYEDENGNIVVVDGKGKIISRIYTAIWGAWATDSYRHGGDGASSIMQLSAPLEKVTEFDFFLEAAGNYGVDVNGDWIIVIRVDGVWVEFPAFALVGGASTQNLKFDKPVTIDAVTAYPTKTGNASYSCNYELRDVHVEYSSGDPMVDLPEMPTTKPQSTSSTCAGRTPAASPADSSYSGSCCPYS